MRNLYRILSVLLISAMTCVPQVDARGRNNGTQSQGQRPTASSPSRPGGNGHGNRPSGNGHGNRPGGNHGNNGNHGNRPGGNGHGNRPGGNGHGNRPGGNPGNRPGGNPGNRPGGNHGNRPGGNHGNRPGGNHDYGHNRPGNRPGHNHGYNRPTPPPNPHHGWHNLHWGRPPRPMMPPPRPFYRPEPPRHFHHHYRPFPVLNTVLGVAFGTAINLSINSLLYSGYNITGYSNDAVYLNNVAQLSLNWPFATLYYNNGILSASEFAYSTSYYDTGRYNVAYNRLINAYGAPYATSPLGNGGIRATWWGNGGQFITLSFAPQYAENGSLRYFTTLSFGN